MSDTQAPALEEVLQVRINSLRTIYQQFAQNEQSLQQQLLTVQANKLKLEGAIEALEGFKSTALESNSAQSTESDEESTEVVDATYIDKTELEN